MKKVKELTIVDGGLSLLDGGSGGCEPSKSSSGGN